MEKWKELVEDNVKLAQWMCRKMNYVDIDKDERESAAYYGLVKAAMKFNEDRGVKFPTFACRVMSNEILIAYRKNKKYNQGISLDAVVTVEDDGCEWADLVCAGTDDTYETVAFNLMADELKKLTDAYESNKQMVLKMCIEHPEWTQARKAKALNLSQSYVSCIEKKIWRDIQNMLNNR